MTTSAAAGTFVGLYGHVRYSPSTALEKLYERRPCEGCGTTSACLDHCHAHGWVRGTLCARCNVLMAAVDARKPGPHLDALLSYWSNCPDCLASGAWSPGTAPVKVPYRGQKTSIYLSADLAAAVKASGVPLAELIRRGLGVSGPVDADTLRLVLTDVLGSDIETRVRTAVREELAGMAAPVAAYSPEPEVDSTRHACRHAAAGVLEGLCTNCGTYLG